MSNKCLESCLFSKVLNSRIPQIAIRTINTDLRRAIGQNLGQLLEEYNGAVFWCCFILSGIVYVILLICLHPATHETSIPWTTKMKLHGERSFVAFLTAIPASEIMPDRISREWLNIAAYIFCRNWTKPNDVRIIPYSCRITSKW